MNILFITLADVRTVTMQIHFMDLMREFVKNGHEVYVVSPAERRYKLKTHFLPDTEHLHILKVKTGNIQKTNYIEKGISTLLVGSQIKNALGRHLSDVKFDMVIYSTPPITFTDPISYIKKRDGAHSYLLLKDIFPQGAVDIGVLSTTGIKGIIYKHFRRTEKKLYALSDKIGCMSKANVDYLLKHNPEIPANKAEICPNCVEPQVLSVTAEKRNNIRERYSLPCNKKIFVYGGNFGKPQDIPFIIECLKTQLDNNGAFFLLVGNGTDYGKLESFFDEYKPKNMMLMKRISRDEYLELITACDVGLIFLDHRFTIPNFPSRLLPYMQAELPVIACTDKNTDIGKVITSYGFGWWCESTDTDMFKDCVAGAMNGLPESYKSGIEHLLNNEFSVEKAYKTIIRNIE